MYLSVCLSVSSAGHWVSCQLVIGSLQVKMTCGGAAAVALSPCPALDRRHSTLSLPHGTEKRETAVIEEEGMSLNAPLTPQNEIDRLAEVIAPSTIFFGRKYCYRQIGDSISGRRWGSRLWSKGCVCPLLLRLQCLSMLYLFALHFPPSPFSLVSNLRFFVRLMLPCASSRLTTSSRISKATSPSLHPSIFPHSRPLGPLLDHFLLLTIFESLKGKTLSASSQQVSPPPSLPPSNPLIVSLLPVRWCNVDIIPKDSIDLG